jgi:cytochrome c-type biogenesis protein CcmH
MKQKLIWMSLVVSLLAGLWALPAAAQDDEPEAPVLREVSDDEVNAIAKDVYCPVCENTPLDVCPTKACADWRELIRAKLAQGETRQDIFDYFARQYGDSALATPPRQGINLILWLLPFVAVALGLVFFARYMQGLHTPEADLAGAVETDSAPDDYASRIEQELRER